MGRKGLTPKNALNLQGKRFGKLTVVERAGRNANGSALWLCRCDCGGSIKANATSLRRGETVSCGCGRPKQVEVARKVLEDKFTVDGVPVPSLTQNVRSDSKSGHKGVYIRNRNGHISYEANITVKGKRYYDGPFSTIDAAIAARKRLEEKHHRPYIEALEDKNAE